MPADTRALTRAARERARHTGESHQAAHTALIAERAAPAAPGRAVARFAYDGPHSVLILTPRPAADTAAPAAEAAEGAEGAAAGPPGWSRTLKIHTMQADNSPDEADRILAEARWVPDTPWPRPVLGPGDEVTVQLQESVPAARAVREATHPVCPPDRPCLCSTYRLTGQPCDHGRPCPGECGGRIVHADRYPGSLWSVRVWEDVFACDTCDAAYLHGQDLPGLPWGQVKTIPSGAQTTTATRAFPGTRHPADSDDFWDGCGECGASGGYGCTCGVGRCQECGASNDAYQCACA